VTDENDSGWFAFGPDDLDHLPADQRALAEKALAEYRAQHPIGTAEVLVYGWDPGQAEVRWGGEACDDVDSQRRLIDTAIGALRDAKAVLDGR